LLHVRLLRAVIKINQSINQCWLDDVNWPNIQIYPRKEDRLSNK